jgi:hypothetical protein
MNEFEDLKKKKKEEKKKGFLAWLREKLGFSPKGMGNLSEGARDINLAGLRGAALRGSGGILGSGGRGIGGIFSFLGGKGAIVTFALIGLAVGVSLYYRGMNNVSQERENYSSMGKVDSYVPKILKEQTNASSLDMFKEANKGAISFDEDETNKNKEEEPKEEQPVVNEKNNQLEANLGFDNKPRLQTDMKFGLSSDIGGGSNKFSALGGFGNHMGKFGPQIGSGFSKNDFDKNSLLKTANAGKLSPIKSQKRPVIAQGYKFQRVKGGKGAFDQAKAIKSMQLAPNYGKADTARSNLDKAWEGGTGGSGSVGLPNGGSGISDGGSGIVQTPSTLDNIGDTTGGINPNTNANIPNVPGYKFDTPWAGLIQKAMMFLMISALLAGIASMLAKIKPWGLIVAIGLALAAVALGVMVIMIGMQLMKQFGQNKLGMIYIIGGGIAIASAIAAIAGVWISWAAMLAKILAAAAGIIAMFASMAAGPAMQKAAEKELNKVNKQTAYVITSSYRKYIG